MKLRVRLSRAVGSITPDNRELNRLRVPPTRHAMTAESFLSMPTGGAQFVQKATRNTPRRSCSTYLETSFAGLAHSYAMRRR